MTLRSSRQTKRLVLVLGLAAFQASAQTWVPTGPTGDFGSSSQPLVNGRVRSLEVYQLTNDYYLYLGGSSGGLWRARGSAGPVWTSLGDALPNPSVGALAVRPGNPDDILVGTGDRGRYAGSGLYHTTDAGLTWNRILLPGAPASFFRIAYVPGYVNILLAASDVGLFRTSGGADGPWTLVLGGFITDFALDPADPALQYCARGTGNNDGGVYRSTDGGITWTVLSATGIPSAACGITRLAVCRTAPGTVAFSYEWGDTLRAIRRSGDAGEHWTDITGTGIAADQLWHVMALAFSPANSSEVWFGANELWRTTDGKTWTGVDKSIDKHQDHTQIYFSPVTGNNVVWICSDGGIYRYVLGGSSSDSWNGNGQSGLRLSQIVTMDARRDYRIIGLQDDGPVATNNRGLTWEGYDCCDSYRAVITEEVPAPTAWFSSDEFNTTMYRRTFGGPEYDVGNSGKPFGYLVCDRHANQVLSVSGGALISKDAAATTPGGWKSELTLSRNSPYLRGSPLPSGTLYYFYSDTIQVLQRTGSTWSVSRTRKLGFTVTELSPSTERVGECWAVTLDGGGNPYIAHTADDWATFAYLGAQGLTAPVFSLAVRPFNSRELFAADENGVLRSTDGGVTWNRFDAGLPKVQARVLRYVLDTQFQGNDRLVLATFGRGVYECDIPGPAIVYVDGTCLTCPGDGSFEHPFGILAQGIVHTPPAGILALRGGGDYYVTAPLQSPMTMNTYAGPVVLQALPQGAPGQGASASTPNVVR